MGAQDLFERALVSLHEAALDPVHWPVAAGLTEEVSGSRGSALGSGGGSWGDATIAFTRVCIGGQRREDLERRYFNEYWHRDERVSRLLRLRHGEVVHNNDLYTDAEKKTSPTYNEFLRDTDSQNGLHVRLHGPEGSNILWNLGDPVTRGGWGSAQVETVTRLLPHVRQFVCARQVLDNAGALGSSLAELLDNGRFGVIHLGRHAGIMAANDRARDLLLRGDGLHDRGGCLRAQAPAEDIELQRLLARAAPPLGIGASAGSITIGRPSSRTRLVVHMNPVTDSKWDLGGRQVAAVVLIVDSESRPRIDVELVARALGLSPTESQLAVMIAAGHTVRDIAESTGRTEGTIRWHLKKIFRKQRVSRQVDLVRRVLAFDGFPSLGGGSPARDDPDSGAP